MRQYFRFLIKPAMVSLVALSFSAPAISHAEEGRHHHHKAVVSAHHRGQKVSRYGHRRQMVAHHRLRHEAVVVADAAAQRPDFGPAEITQISDASSPLLLQSRAALVMDENTGTVLYGKNTNRTMPIASISKLMTAMVVLDANLPLSEPVTVTEDDVDHYKHTSSRLAVGTTLPRGEMMLVALMASENRAAHALARTYPGGTEAAVAAMNRKARALGMTSTSFLDPTGLHSENQSTPHDLVLMVQAAHKYAEIHKDTTTAEHDIVVATGRMVEYHNTDPLVKSDSWDIGVSKTGFINEAGKCLVMQARIHEKPVVIVLMDSWGSYTRIGDANRVKKWIESALPSNETTAKVGG